MGVAHVPDGRGTFMNLTVEENLRLGAHTRRDRAEVGADFERMYAHFPRLKERRRQQAGTLSGGEQQMLAVSRALMLRPRLLLLDEPSFGLAPLIVQQLFEILRAINQSDRISMLLVEQNAALALQLADHAYLLETGRVVMSGTGRDDPQRRVGAPLVPRLLSARGDERPPAPGALRPRHRRHLRQRRAGAGDDLPGDPSGEFRAGRDGDVLRPTSPGR